MNAKLRGDGGVGLPIVFVPGIDGTGALLLATGAKLEARHRLIRIAYSIDSQEVPDTYEALAADVARVVREQGVERCVVIAASFGGAVALQLALDEPELVAGLLIVNSFAYYAERKRLSLAMKLSPLLPESAFNFGRKWFAPRNLFGRRRDARALADFRALPGSFFDEGYDRRMHMIEGLDLRPRLPEVRQPVALYAGDADRIVPSSSSMKVIKDGISAATLEVLAGGGHLVLPLEEEPWLERVEDLARRAGMLAEN